MDVEFMLHDSLEVGLPLLFLPDPSYMASRPSVRNWCCSRPLRRPLPQSTKCSPLHSRPPVVCDLVHLNMELVPDYMRIVITGDDSGDDSGDEGPGREREEEEDTEGTISPVGELGNIVVPG